MFVDEIQEDFIDENSTIADQFCAFVFNLVDFSFDVDFNEFWVVQMR